MTWGRHRGLQLFVIFYFLSWKLGEQYLLCALQLLVRLADLLKMDLLLFPISASTNFILLKTCFFPHRLTRRSNET